MESTNLLRENLDISEYKLLLQGNGSVFLNLKTEIVKS